LQKESKKDAYYRRQTKFLVGICSRLTKQVVYQRRLLSSSCSWPAFLFPTSQVRLQWKVRRRYQRRFATIATKMPPQLATTSFRQRSEHSDLASITVAESFFYISRLNIRTEAEPKNIVPQPPQSTCSSTRNFAGRCFRVPLMRLRTHCEKFALWNSRLSRY